MSDFITVKEVAEKLHVSKTTVYNWIENGTLQAFRTKTTCRIQKNELNDFISKHLTKKKEDKSQTKNSLNTLQDRYGF